MPTVSLITTHAYVYDGRSLSKGEKFEASEDDARVLKLVGQAIDAPKRQTRSYETRELTDSHEPDAPKSKRKYQRRDLVSEA